MLHWAVLECSGPVAVRYPRGGNGLLNQSAWDPRCGVVSHRQGADGAIIPYGTLVNQAILAADILAQRGLSVSVIRLTKLNPIAASGLEAALAGQKNVLIVEEAIGGIGADLSCVIREIQNDAHVMAIDLGKEYVTHGTVAQLYQKHGLDAQSIADKFMEVR